MNSPKHGSEQTYRLDRENEAEWIRFSPTNLFRVIAEGAPGLADMFEERAKRGDGPPLHRHAWPSWEMIIEGTLRFVVDDETFTASAGDVVYIEPNVPHTYVVESDMARTVGINQSDGRFPALQRQASEILLASEGPDMGRLTEIARSQGLEVLGPPLEPETQD